MKDCLDYTRNGGRVRNGHYWKKARCSPFENAYKNEDKSLIKRISEQYDKLLLAMAFWLAKPPIEKQPDKLRIKSDEEISLEREREMYERNKEHYLSNYEGKYIALLSGVVLDSDKDFSNLAKRVFEKNGYKPIYMPLVTREEKEYKIASPKFKNQ